MEAFYIHGTLYTEVRIDVCGNYLKRTAQYLKRLFLIRETDVNISRVLPTRAALVNIESFDVQGRSTEVLVLYL